MRLKDLVFQAVNPANGLCKIQIQSMATKTFHGSMDEVGSAASMLTFRPKVSCRHVRIRQFSLGRLRQATIDLRPAS